jgi:hypothetical protein
MRGDPRPPSNCRFPRYISNESLPAKRAACLGSSSHSGPGAQSRGPPLRVLEPQWIRGRVPSPYSFDGWSRSWSRDIQYRPKCHTCYPATRNIHIYTSSMDARDMTRRRLSQATLAGLNMTLLKTGTPAADFSGSSCGFYNASTCAWDLSGGLVLAPVYPTYELKALVDNGLLINGCVPSGQVTMSVQPPYVCPDVVYTIPLDTTNITTANSGCSC